MNEIKDQLIREFLIFDVKNVKFKTDNTFAVEKKEFTNPAVQFIHKNKDELTAIYKQIYQGYVPGANNNEEKMMKNFKNLSEKDKNLIYLLQDKIGSILLGSESGYGLSLYETTWHYWFDTNVYYSPNTVSQFTVYLKSNILPNFQFLGNLAESLSEGAETLEGTGEFGEDAAAVLYLISALLLLIQKAGPASCENLFNEFLDAANQGKGVTNHWLFGAFYVGSSIGKVSWWGA